MRWYLLFICWLLVPTSPSAIAMVSSAVLPEHESLVPRHLLALLHAPEVQAELGLEQDQVGQLEMYFQQVDGDWFRARILPLEKQQTVLRDLEQRTHDWLKQNATEQQRERLRQVECQAQSVRMFCRTDVARDLALDTDQRQRFIELAESTQSAQAAYQQAARDGTEGKLKSDLEAAVRREQEAIKSILRPEQHQRLWRYLGKPFETKQLSRIYPMAPELVPVDQWVNTAPLTLAELRGKVVLVHFYAFQCHNCHANFEIYKRWHQELAEKGVVVVGIQTPETAAERDPSLVRTAAAERGLHFPILIDLDSANWKAWGNTMWPTVYVIDQRGYLRHWWQGELNWKGAKGDDAIEEVVQKILAEAASVPNSSSQRSAAQ